jgi:hypothetical protein
LTGIYEINPLEDSRWSEFVRTHPQASVFHTSSWLRALHSAYGYETRALCPSPPGKYLTSALVFCHVKSWLTGNRIVSLPFSDHCEPLTDTTEELNALVLHLKHGIDEKHWDYFEMRPHIHVPSGAIGLERCGSYFSHAVDLSASGEALFQSLHKNCVQRKIRRAERESLQYESGNSEGLLTKFYRLHIMTRRRHHVPPQPLYWFLHLGRALGNSLQIRLASHNGRPVASILTLKFGKTITFKYGCRDAYFYSLGGTALLFRKTIEEAKREGMTQFDLGRSQSDNAGLIPIQRALER